MKSLAEIQNEVCQLAAQIGAPAKLLPTYGKTEDGARPHIEVDSKGYHYVVVERGEELERITTHDFDELLYHIFESVTFNLAIDYELAHRIENRDCRRLNFGHQIELLSKISSAWAERESRRHKEILRQHPFDDNSDVRVRLSKQVGWAKACEKYPLPVQAAP
jgi:hypothetical protein